MKMVFSEAITIAIVLKEAITVKVVHRGSKHSLEQKDLKFLYSEKSNIKCSLIDCGKLTCRLYDNLGLKVGFLKP